MKYFNRQLGIGKSKYIINFHDGEKKHKDGSIFFDIAIFSNKKDFFKMISQLKKDNYIELNLFLINNKTLTPKI